MPALTQERNKTARWRGHSKCGPVLSPDSGRTWLHQSQCLTALGWWLFCGLGVQYVIVMWQVV